MSTARRISPPNHRVRAARVRDDQRGRRERVAAGPRVPDARDAAAGRGTFTSRDVISSQIFTDRQRAIVTRFKRSPSYQQALREAIDRRQTAAARAGPRRRRHRLARRRHRRREPARRDRPRARGRHDDPAAQAPGGPNGDCRLTPSPPSTRTRGRYVRPRVSSRDLELDPRTDPHPRRLLHAPPWTTKERRETPASWQGSCPGAPSGAPARCSVGRIGAARLRRPRCCVPADATVAKRHRQSASRRKSLVRRRGDRTPSAVGSR